MSAEPVECGLLNIKILYFQTNIKFSVRLERETASEHNVLPTFPHHRFVRNIRNMASYHTRMETLHTPQGKSKNLQNSLHHKMCTRPVRFKLQGVSPTFGS